MSRWNKFNEAPFLKSLHGYLTIQWAFHLPVVVFVYFAFPKTWDKISILYLSLVSIYANVVSHAGAWQAGRAEIEAKKN